MNPWQFQMAQAALVIAALMTGGCAWLALKQPRPRGAWPCSGMLAAVSLWCCAYMLELHADTLSTKLIWVRIQYLGIASVAPLWFTFVLQFTHRDRLLSPALVALLFVIPTVTWGLALTLSSHDLIYTEAALVERQAFVGLETTYGLWFWVHSLYSYGLWAAGVCLLLATGLHYAWRYRAPYLGLTLSAFAPVIPNLHWIARGARLIDGTPFGFAFAALAIHWALRRYLRPEIMPLARDQMIEQMPDGVLVFDRERRIVDANAVAQRILGLHNGRLAPQTLPSDAWAILADAQASDGVKSLWFGDGTGQRCYDISILPVFQRNGRPAGQMAIFRDVTERQRLLTELQEALSRVKTLSGLIPICASCKKVRNDAGYWESVEVYIRDHTDAEMTHGLCPDCMQRLLEDMERLSAAD